MIYMFVVLETDSNFETLILKNLKGELCVL